MFLNQTTAAARIYQSEVLHPLLSEESSHCNRRNLKQLHCLKQYESFTWDEKIAW